MKISHIRMIAAITLGEIGDERAITPLTQSLKEKNQGSKMKY